MSRLLFLSHSGIDADAAKALKKRLLATPAAREHALSVWFDDADWAVVQKLASDEGKGLVPIGGSDEQATAETAHEALVTAWPCLQNLLQETADEKRVFDALIPRAQGWGAEAAPEERTKRLAVGADFELFDALADRHRPGFPKLRTRS